MDISNVTSLTLRYGAAGNAAKECDCRKTMWGVSKAYAVSCTLKFIFENTYKLMCHKYTSKRPLSV